MYSLIVTTDLKQTYMVKQEASLKTASAATRVPPHMCTPLICKLAIQGHTPADCTCPLSRVFMRALPHFNAGNRDHQGWAKEVGWDKFNNIVRLMKYKPSSLIRPVI